MEEREERNVPVERGPIEIKRGVLSLSRRADKSYIESDDTQRYVIADRDRHCAILRTRRVSAFDIVRLVMQQTRPTSTVSPGTNFRRTIIPREKGGTHIQLSLPLNETSLPLRVCNFPR